MAVVTEGIVPTTAAIVIVIVIAMAMVVVVVMKAETAAAGYAAGMTQPPWATG
jgi:preprotein translocase subunit SecG